MDILFEDDCMVAAVKPVGVDAESGMVQLLGGGVYPVHRLDQAVGGVMVFARTAAAAAELTRQIQSGRFQKEYLAVLPAAPEAAEGELRDLLYFDRSRRKSFVVKRPRAGVKEAVLDYRVVQRSGENTLVKVHLHTGRTHQIRVQFASRKLPLLGDGKYGSRDNGCTVALWSHRIGIFHPKTGKALSFSAAPPRLYPWNGFCV